MPNALTTEVHRFLDAPRFGVMATINADGSVAQSVVWYAMRGDRVLINTRRGRLKDRNLRREAVSHGWPTLTFSNPVSLAFTGRFGGDARFPLAKGTHLTRGSAAASPAGRGEMTSGPCPTG